MNTHLCFTGRLANSTDDLRTEIGAGKDDDGQVMLLA